MAHMRCDFGQPEWYVRGENVEDLCIRRGQHKLLLLLFEPLPLHACVCMCMCACRSRLRAVIVGSISNQC